MSAQTVAAASAAAASAAGPLRLVPAPSTEPRASGARLPAVAPRLRIAPAWEQGVLPLRLAASGAFVDDPLFDRQPTVCADLPDPTPLAAALVRAAVEVLGGARPASQLLRWLSADVYAGLQRRAVLSARVTASHGGRSARPRAGSPVVRVRRVVLGIPRDGVAEAAVTVQDGHRVRAVGVRLEGLDGRWRVTALEVG